LVICALASEEPVMPRFDNIFRDAFKQADTTGGHSSQYAKYNALAPGNKITHGVKAEEKADLRNIRISIASRLSGVAVSSDFEFGGSPFVGNPQNPRDNTWDGKVQTMRFLKWEYPDINNRVACHASGPKFFQGNTDNVITGAHSFVVGKDGYLRVGSDPTFGHELIHEHADVIYAGSVDFSNEGFVVAWTNQTGSYDSFRHITSEADAKTLLKMMPFPKSKFQPFKAGNKSERTYLAGTEWRPKWKKFDPTQG
jgi:hypothetical protein